MNPALRRSAAHVFVESLAAPVLDDTDRHHLGTVMRLRAGEVVSACDGAGSWRLCRFAAGAGLEPDGEIVVEAAAVMPITVGFALPKGDRPEWIVQKLTEIGVDRIVIVRADRAVVRWDDAKLPRQLARLRTVVREAAMQSRRLRLPTIEGPSSVAALAALGEVALAEPGGDALELERPTVLIGPEGGWTDGELALASATVELGPTVLRVETAAVVAAARLTAIRGNSATD